MIFPTVNAKILNLLLFIVSSLLIMLSIFLIIRVFPGVIRNEVIKNVKLEKGTEQYDRFLELPFPVDFKVYFFNIENSLDILKGEKPIVREIGPYVYKQYRKKTIYSTDDEEDTVSYTQRERFEFDYDASGNLTDEDFVLTLNTPMMSILQTAENFGTSGALSGCLKDILPDLDTVFIKVKVKDILFDGLHFCPRHLSLCEFQRTIACSIAEKKKNVDKLDDGSLQFSLFNYKVKSDDGLYTVKRGIKNIQTLGQIVRLNNSTYTNFWERLGTNSTCDTVNGSDSTLYPPEISKDSIFQIYSTDICRFVEIEFLQEVIYKGIKGYLFVTNNSTLRSENKEENCFCAKETRGVNGEESCFLDGVIDMQPCIGVPVLLSFPHFLWADKFYIDGVFGISPNEEIHRTYLTVEPETGTPLEGIKRIQINAVLRPVDRVKQTEYLPRVVLPLLWIEEGASLTDEYIDKLQEMYFHKMEIVNIVEWFFLAGSVLLTIIFGSCYISKRISCKHTN